jgi:tape measure domain-containing protein
MDRQLQIVLKLQDQASGELRNVLGHLNGVQQGAQGAAGSIDNAAQSVLRLASSYLSFRTIYEGLSLGLRTAADLQTFQIGIQTLTGSAKDAADTIARIKIEAMRTPFQINGLARATQLMSSVTHDGGKALDLVLNMGEALAALGKGEPELDRVMINMQQIAALGWAQNIDIKQFAYAGIPIYDMLAKETGIARDGLGDFIKNHGVTYQLLVDMFDKANDAGGRFFHAYQNQLGTFSQAWSNMQDSIAFTLANLVKYSGVFSLLTQGMLAFTAVVQNHPALAAGTFVLVGALAALIGVLSSIGIIAPLVAAGFTIMMGPVGLLIAAFALSGIAIFTFKDILAALISDISAHTGIVTMFHDAWQLVYDAWVTNLLPALTQLSIALQPLTPYLSALGLLIRNVLALAIGETVRQIGLWIEGTAQLLALLIKAVAWFVTTLSPAIRAIGTDIDWVVSKVEALTSAFSKLSGIKSSTLGGIGSNLLGGVASGVMHAITPFADGGIITRPTLGLIGEAGPEAIIPLSQARGLGGGVTVNVYGDVTGMELVQRVKDELMRAMRFDGRLAI